MSRYMREADRLAAAACEEVERLEQTGHPNAPQLRSIFDWLLETDERALNSGYWPMDIEPPLRALIELAHNQS